MKLKKFLLFSVAACTAIAAYALGVEVCPIDGSNMSYTGNSRQEMGKTLAEYKCVQDHIYWVVVR